MHLITTCILLCLAGQEGLSARILGLFPFPGRSHFSITSPVMHALVEKGHDVTMFVPSKSGYNASNYREIVYEAEISLVPIDLMDFIKKPFVMRHIGIDMMGLSMTELGLNNPQAKALIKSKEKYDIIVMEFFWNEAFLAFVHKFECPVVLINTFGTTSAINNIFGNSAPYSYVPSKYLALTDRMTFFERIEHTLANIFIDVTRKYYYMPKQQALVDKYWADSGINLPPLEEIERKANFILINSHHAFSTPRPYMSNMKDVAGIHMKPSKPLPSDLQEYLDSSKNGVILFNLGSVMKSTMMSDSIASTLKGAFARLPYDVLWKWENDTMADKPNNVRLGKWLPQYDILGHPNVKLFITHVGISSLMETVHQAVPIVGIPLFGDQYHHALVAKSKGYAEILDFVSMTEDEVYNTIMKVSTDPKYRENVKKVSAYWRDEMNNPLNEAVHWVEYVLKHDGAKHLKAVVTEQTFIQYFLLDVGFAILLILALVYLLIRRILKMLCGKSSPKKNLKKTE